MKKIIVLLFFVAGFSVGANAQRNNYDYKSAIGGRVGTTYYDLFSFSYKTFITQNGAIELNAGFGSRGIDNYNTGTFEIAATYQHHFDIKPVEGLKWFVGGGVTLFNTFSKFDDYDGFGIGIFPTGGLDYKFGNIPLNLSAEFRPTVHVVGPG